MEMIWANLLHLSTNMWVDYERPKGAAKGSYYDPSLRFEEAVWRDVVARMVDAGMNMVVIDLGDGVRYESHPEIAVKGAWTPKKLRRELARLRGVGLEPIPKLNFSTCHDAWLGPYSRMVSTDAYYAVCADLIAEAASLFDRPRLFHLGMDEETPQHQRRHQYMVVRQGDLWWHDFLFLARQVKEVGVRPWIWSDYVWHHADEFFARMPKYVLQSNWYYDRSFSKKIRYVQAYLDLEKHGYDQIPTGSNLAGYDWASPDNFERTVPWCAKHISPKRLVGFLQTTWRPTTARNRHAHMDAVERVTKGMAKLAGRRGP
jgi:hypothetical protein